MGVEYELGDVGDDDFVLVNVGPTEDVREDDLDELVVEGLAIIPLLILLVIELGRDNFDIERVRSSVAEEEEVAEEDRLDLLSELLLLLLLVVPLASLSSFPCL